MKEKSEIEEKAAELTEEQKKFAYKFFQIKSVFEENAKAGKQLIHINDNGNKTPLTYKGLQLGLVRTDLIMVLTENQHGSDILFKPESLTWEGEENVDVEWGGYWAKKDSKRKRWEFGSLFIEFDFIEALHGTMDFGVRFFTKLEYVKVGDGVFTREDIKKLYDAQQ